ncbi:hypothetical protein OKW21_005352 [Catalinimonas alkaloidigena]|nr:hypothetical protein [Catalinimonas alkaloidigena]
MFFEGYENCHQIMFRYFTKYLISSYLYDLR